MADAPKKRKRVTIRTLNKKMREGEMIVQMAIYDYRSAVIADRQDIDILCVSDTGGMILFGHKSTVTVSFNEVMMMAQAIDRGSQYGMRMVDMPYWSFHVSPEQAVENAGRFVHEANAEVMKCEGNLHHARNIEAIIKAGIPVQGHIGITPMRMCPAPVAVVVDPGYGMARLFWRQGQDPYLDAYRVEQMVASLRAAASPMGGYVTIERCPSPVKEQLDIWDGPAEGQEVMRRIKDNLDPAGVLNSGRFVGRL